MHGRMMMTFPNLTVLKSRLPIWNHMRMWTLLALIVICIRRMAVFPARPRKQDFLFNSPFIHGSILFRRRCFEKVSGYPVMEKIARYEDYMLFMQLYAAGLQGANLQECLYQYYFDSKTRRIPVRERLDEAIVRWRGFHMLNLMPKGLPYIGKPLILALLPPKLIHHMHS